MRLSIVIASTHSKKQHEQHNNASTININTLGTTTITHKTILSSNSTTINMNIGYVVAHISCEINKYPINNNSDQHMYASMVDGFRQCDIKCVCVRVNLTYIVTSSR